MDVGECQRGGFRARLHSGRKVAIPPTSAKDRNRKRQVNQIRIRISFISVWTLKHQVRSNQNQIDFGTPCGIQEGGFGGVPDMLRDC
jgi:hypothetical protein